MMAKYAALKKTSDSLREDSKKPFGEDLKAKKMSKITVAAPDEKSLAKGLSKAQEILKAKFGEMGLEEDEMSEETEGEEIDCPACDNEGCEECYESEEEVTEE